jgi:AraC family transcriptional regulator
MSLRDELKVDPAVSVLYASSQVAVGEFHAGPDDPRWSAENCTSEAHFIVFPGRSVGIAQEGQEPIVADPHLLVFYNRNQVYRRRIVSRDGDHCSFIAVAPQLFDEMSRAGVPGLGDAERRPFPSSHARSNTRHYLAQQLLIAELKRSAADGLEMEERLVDLVERAVRQLSIRRPLRRGARATTLRVHRELAEDARAAIAVQLGARLTLDGLATEVGASPYHLARVFRTETGKSLHAYRDELRLRASLPLVTALGDHDLTWIALELGYASLAHFSDRFRRLFGVPPSAVRGLQVRRILKAHGTSAS